MLRDQVLMQAQRGASPFLTQKPDWAKDQKLKLSRLDIQKFERTTLEAWPRQRFEGLRVHVEVVFRPDHDIIYQFFFPRKLKLRGTDFESLLADTVDAHFGTLKPFSLDEVPEVESWAMLARNVRDLPMYNADHYAAGFITLLDLALDEAEKTP